MTHQSSAPGGQTPREIWDCLTGRMQERLEMFCRETQARKIDHRSDKAMLQFNLIKIVKPPYSVPHYVDFAVITELGCRVYEAGQIDESPILSEIATLERELAARDATIAAALELCAETKRRGEDYIGGMAQIEAVLRGDEP